MKILLLQSENYNFLLDIIVFLICAPKSESNDCIRLTVGSSELNSMAYAVDPEIFFNGVTYA